MENQANKDSDAIAQLKRDLKSALNKAESADSERKNLEREVQRAKMLANSSRSTGTSSRESAAEDNRKFDDLNTQIRKMERDHKRAIEDKDVEVERLQTDVKKQQGLVEKNNQTTQDLEKIIKKEREESKQAAYVLV